MLLPREVDCRYRPGTFLIMIRELHFDPGNAIPPRKYVGGASIHELSSLAGLSPFRGSETQLWFRLQTLPDFPAVPLSELKSG